MFPECGWDPGEGVCALDSQLGGKPCTGQNARFSPSRWRQVVLSLQMLGESCE
jgi:hypothetical protein